MKPVTLLLGAVVIILMMAAVLTAVDNFRMTEYEESHIVTTANVTTAPVTLSQELFSDETYNAGVTSNVTADAPIPSSYVSSTQVLTVSGLAVSETRLLTITYQIDALEDYFGASLGARVWPLMLVLGVIGVIVGAVYNATRHGE